MADTSRLNEVTEYIMRILEEKYNTNFTNKKIRIGSQGVEKKFSGVSTDNKVLIHVCHHSGRTKSGNIPVGKLNGLFAKCYLMEKTKAERKVIYFTNEEFYNIFRDKSLGITDGIELRYFKDLPQICKQILSNVIEDASNEMM